MKENVLNYKKISEEIVKQIVHHEESIDENGNIIPPYDEVIDKVIPIMGTVYEEMTEDEILSLENDLSLENKVSDNEEPTQLDEIQAQLMYTAVMTGTLL